MNALKKATIPQRRRLTELLLEVSNKIALAGNLSEAFDMLAQITASIVGAERGSIFLNDPRTGELYTRIVTGKLTRETRMLNNLGIAGHVFTTARGVIVTDAYSDERFNPDIDKITGYTTANILCVPLRTPQGHVIGASELLNKKEGKFTEDDLELLEAVVRQAVI